MTNQCDCPECGQPVPAPADFVSEQTLVLIGARFLQEAKERSFAKHNRDRSPLHDGLARDGFRAVATYMRRLLRETL